MYNLRESELMKRQRSSSSFQKEISFITQMTNDIIHESDNKNWMLHMNALFDCVSWLYSHTINVALLSGLIGTGLNLSYPELKELVLGSLLHDIGLVLIPDDILGKTDIYNRDEFEMMQRHAELGHSLLKNSDLPESVLKIVLQHHERIDGSGYPFGLKEKFIHPFAQIVSISESFDSATSYRPYKEKKDISDVILELANDPSYNQKLVSTIAHLKHL